MAHGVTLVIWSCGKSISREEKKSHSRGVLAQYTSLTPSSEYIMKEEADKAFPFAHLTEPEPE